MDWHQVKRIGQDYGWMFALFAALGLATLTAFAWLTDRWPFHTDDVDQDDEPDQPDREVTPPP